MNEWATPLLVMPGVGLLIMSTGVRYARLHDELHHHLHMMACDPGVAHRLLLRGRLFRSALVMLYGAVSLLALAGLAGGIEAPAGVSSGLLGLGVFLLVCASVVLMRETMVSLDVIEAEAQNLKTHVHEPSPKEAS